ncbi:MAG TPA: metalloregulator ArsR/SmtB family transcription factor [Streptosporangiaceae bacterium]
METYGVEALGALGDPTRRAIFERLAQRPMAVGELSAGLPVSRPAVSQHLKVLKEAALVADRADGTRRIYQVNPAGVDAIRTYLDQLWSRALGEFQQAAQRLAENDGQPGRGDGEATRNKSQEESS